MKTLLFRIFAGGLLLAGLLTPSTAQAKVSVYGAASSSGELITVQVFANISSIPIMSYSCKTFYDPSLLQVVEVSRNEAVWYLFDGTQLVPYLEPDTTQPGEVLLLGGRLDASQPLEGVMGNGVLLGTVVFSRLNPNTPSFSVDIGRPGDFASFVANNGVVLESLPGEVTFGSIRPDRNDQDLDGLNDRWEVEHFKDIRLAFFSDDPDQDNVINQGEERLGSDPTDSRSNLQLAIIHQPKMLSLEWTSFEDRFYTIEAGDRLGKFQAIETRIKATPPVNTYELKLSENSDLFFFRILLE